LAGACEKFFCVLEVDDVGMVVVADVIDDPHSKFMVKAMTKMPMLMAIPPLQAESKGRVEDADVEGPIPRAPNQY
jgi:hypothetical protein